MIDDVLSVFAPHYCYFCGQIGKTICDNCKFDITSEAFDGCIGCQGLTAGQGVCGRCHLPYARAWVVDTYQGPLGEAIKGMKIVSIRESAKVLGVIMAEMLPTLPSTTIIVPIPTLRAHRRSRGFDHTQIIARSIAKQFNLPLENLLIRVGNSSQRGSTAKQRRKQAKEAFMVKKKLDPNKTYLVIDDVVTTSATIREAGLQLRQAGATELWVASLTRETLD